MPATLTEMFRSLTSFAPGRVDLRGAPWEQYVEWAIGQGLAPLSAYNLEYRMGGAGAPPWARDQLLSLYQGTLNDNVMKLVNFKRSVDDLEGRKVILLGAGSFAESLYPHVGFRPVAELRLLLAPSDLEGFIGFMGGSDFKPTPPGEDAGSAERALSDGRTLILLHGRLTRDDEQLRNRALPMKVMGPSMFRLELEDAILIHALLISQAHFEVPMLEWIDLRELVLGSPSMGGVYSRALDPEAILTRARAWKLDRALYACLAVLEQLYPDTAPAVARLKVELNWPTRELIDRLLVAQVAQVGRTQTFRLEAQVRELLTGA
ncbi:MAG: hypothetical protein H6Q89_2455 [Myxococcaceae bacterium]|nr:hypothetical protein [Myxococcaceae bacterium]